MPIKSRDGRALLSDDEQEARWVEHILNQPIPPMLLNFDLETPAPTLNVTLDEITGTEVARAIKSLKNNKAPGLDEVTAKLLAGLVRKLLWRASRTCSTRFGMLKRSQPTGDVGSL